MPSVVLIVLLNQKSVLYMKILAKFCQKHECRNTQKPSPNLKTWPHGMATVSEFCHSLYTAFVKCLTLIY